MMTVGIPKGWPLGCELSLSEALMHEGAREVSVSYGGPGYIDVIADGVEMQFESEPYNGYWHGCAWKPVMRKYRVMMPAQGCVRRFCSHL